jgi:hypothetical protein
MNDSNLVLEIGLGLVLVGIIFAIIGLIIRAASSN